MSKWIEMSVLLVMLLVAIDLGAMTIREGLIVLLPGLLVMRAQELRHRLGQYEPEDGEIGLWP